MLCAFFFSLLFPGIIKKLLRLNFGSIASSSARDLGTFYVWITFWGNFEEQVLRSSLELKPGSWSRLYGNSSKRRALGDGYILCTLQGGEDTAASWSGLASLVARATVSPSWIPQNWGEAQMVVLSPWGLPPFLALRPPYLEALLTENRTVKNRARDWKGNIFNDMGIV